jgi:hypothetical protein
VAAISANSPANFPILDGCSNAGVSFRSKRVISNLKTSRYWNCQYREPTPSRVGFLQSSQLFEWQVHSRKRLSTLAVKRNRQGFGRRPVTLSCLVTWTSLIKPATRPSIGSAVAPSSVEPCLLQDDDRPWDCLAILESGIRRGNARGHEKNTVPACLVVAFPCHICFRANRCIDPA